MLRVLAFHNEDKREKHGSVKSSVFTSMLTPFTKVVQEKMEYKKNRVARTRRGQQPRGRSGFLSGQTGQTHADLLAHEKDVRQMTWMCPETFS